MHVLKLQRLINVHAEFRYVQFIKVPEFGNMLLNLNAMLNLIMSNFESNLKTETC